MVSDVIYSWLLSHVSHPFSTLPPPHPHPSSTPSAKAKARPNPLLLGLDPLRYFLRCLRSVKAPDLEQALLVLPFHYVARFVPMLLQVGEARSRGYLIAVTETRVLSQLPCLWLYLMVIPLGV